MTTRSPLRLTRNLLKYHTRTYGLVWRRVAGYLEAVRSAKRPGSRRSSRSAGPGPDSSTSSPPSNPASPSSRGTTGKTGRTFLKPDDGKCIAHQLVDNAFIDIADFPRARSWPTRSGSRSSVADSTGWLDASAPCCATSPSAPTSSLRKVCGSSRCSYAASSTSPVFETAPCEPSSPRRRPSNSPASSSASVATAWSRRSPETTSTTSPRSATPSPRVHRRGGSLRQPRRAVEGLGPGARPDRSQGPGVRRVGRDWLSAP